MIMIMIITLDKRILAKAWDKRMSDSSCLGVAVIVFDPLPPNALIDKYPSTNAASAPSVISGATFERAYIIYSRKES